MDRLLAAVACRFRRGESGGDVEVCCMCSSWRVMVLRVSACFSKAVVSAVTAVCVWRIVCSSSLTLLEVVSLACCRASVRFCSVPKKASISVLVVAAEKVTDAEAEGDFKAVGGGGLEVVETPEAALA